MITIIAGSRSAIDYNIVLHGVEACLWKITRIISGGARGADKLGEKYAARMNIPVTIMYADWEKYGKSAGYRRNVEMGDAAEALIALWDGQSKGTKHMIHIAKSKMLKVFVWEYTAPVMDKTYPKVTGL